MPEIPHISQCHAYRSLVGGVYKRGKQCARRAIELTSSGSAKAYACTDLSAVSEITLHSVTEVAHF